tara:strand:+ start:310 stop:963 length:654 start_codon:yes stop_codon:yes gene_type:complete
MDNYVLPTKPKPSEKYIELLEAYKELHKEESKFRGISLVPFAIDLYDLIRFNKCKSIIDYGCGKAIAYKENFKEIDPKKKIPNFTVPLHKWWGVDELSLYDPGVPEHSKLPTKKADLVICTDVLEHIPEEDLDWVIREICRLSNSSVFINVSCMDALKTFTTGKYKGENVHVSVFDNEWWVKKVKNIWEENKDLKIYLTCTNKQGIIGTCIKGDKDA